jgi:DNA-binding SARP family transcriptional activator
MSAIEFRTLGTLDLRTADGRELHSLLAQSKRIALLAYLCTAQPSGFHRRDKLLGLFWPDVDHEHARASLRKALHVLRHSLGEETILSRGDDDVAVDFERISCDAVKFEESLRADRFEDALELYGGDLLSGFFVDDAPAFEQWLTSERARLRSSAARAALSVATKFETLGNFAAAITWTRRSLELSDNDESALRKLIDLQRRAGDRGGAMQTYEEFVGKLASEYQTEPSSETTSLIERIRSADESPSNKSKARILRTEESHANASAAAAPISAATPTRHKRDRREKILFAVAAVSVLVAAGFVSNYWGRMRPEPPKHLVQNLLVLDSTEAMVGSTPWSGRIAISPDGLLLAYVGGPRTQILMRPRSQLHATPMPGTEGAMSPFFSPDGKRLGFLREGMVQMALVNGGEPITVSDSLNGVAGASWGPDNFIYVDSRSLVRVEAKAGATPHWFTMLDSAAGETHHSWPDVLPNGKGVLFTVLFVGRNGVKGAASSSIAVAEIPSGKHHVILDDAMYARYAAPGYLLYITTNKSLMVVAFDQNSMEIKGEPTALTEGMRLGVLGSADLVLDTTGTLIYATGTGVGNQELVWVTRDGNPTSVDRDWAGFYMGSPTLSPDGKSVAETRYADPNVPSSIWIKRLDRGPSIKLVLGNRDSYMPAWTADGKSVTFSYEDGKGGLDLWTQRADGSAKAVMQFHWKSKLYNARWSPDGKWLLFQTDADSRGAGDILAIRPGIDTAPVRVVASRFSELSPVLSPNGRFLAYVSNESGKDEIYVVPFPNTGTAKWQISATGGTEPVWSHRGNELFYRDASGNMVDVELNTSPTFSLVRSTVLFPAAGFTTLRWNPQYAVSPDDQRFLMIRPLQPKVPDKIIVVENWLEELKSGASGSSLGVRH